MTNPSDMPARFAAKLSAALARPLMLDAGHVDAVASAGAFKPLPSPRADDGDETSADDAGMSIVDGVAIVSISGPLAQRAWSCWAFSGDGYDAIATRMKDALAAADAVVMRIDSPGGEVAGCFDAVRSIRAMASAAGKPIVAYADETCASAAYALACAADKIVAPETGFVGSIGVITVVGDRVAANKAEGVNLRVVRSGKLKATPHPDEPLTDAGVARVQHDIDALAQVFARTVSDSRGLSVADVMGLEAALFIASEAHAFGLIDQVGNIDSAIALAKSLATSTGMSPAYAAPAATPSESFAGQYASASETHMKSLLAAMGLAPDASEAEAVAAFASHRDALSQVCAIAGAKNPAEAVAIVGAFKASHVRVASLEADAKALSARVEATERNALVDAAISSGKLTPAHLDASSEQGAFLASLSNAQLKAYLAVAVAPVALGSAGAREPATAEKSAAKLTNAELKMCKEMQVSPEEFLARKAHHAANPSVFVSDEE